MAAKIQKKTAENVLPLFQTINLCKIIENYFGIVFLKSR